MKFSSRRFTVEEFSEQQSWIGILLSPINQLFQELSFGFSNNLTIADNLKQEIKEVKFVNDSSNLPLSFKTKFVQPPKGLYVIYCQATDSSTASNTPWLTWTYNNGNISISSITNLTASKTYTVRILIIYE